MREGRTRVNLHNKQSGEVTPVVGLEDNHLLDDLSGVIRRTHLTGASASVFPTLPTRTKHV